MSTLRVHAQALVVGEIDFDELILKEAKLRVDAQAVVYEPGSLPEDTLADELTKVQGLTSDLYVLYTQIKNMEQRALEEARALTDKQMAEDGFTELEQEDTYEEELAINLSRKLADALGDVQYEAENILTELQPIVTDPTTNKLINNAGVDIAALIQALESLENIELPHYLDFYGKIIHGEDIDLQFPALSTLQETALKLRELTRGPVPAEDQEDEFYERVDYKGARMTKLSLPVVKRKATEQDLMELQDRINSIHEAATVALAELRAQQWGALDMSLNVIKSDVLAAQHSLDVIFETE